MRTITLFAMLLLMGVSTGHAQGQLSKLERKELKQEEKRRNLEKLFTIVNQRTFIIEADNISDRYGRRLFVNPSTNFLIVEDSTAIIQLALNNGLGFNGLGGITLEGRLTSFEVKKDADNKKPIFMKARVFGTALGSIDLFLDLYSDGRSVVRFSSQYGHRFSLDGSLINLDESLPFVGTRSF